MKLKKWRSFIAMILLLLFVTVLYYQKNFKTLEKAIKGSNISIDEIYYSIEKDGNAIIIYRNADFLSAALIEKNFFGYRWCCGSGSEDFNQNDSILTKSFTNLLSCGSVSKEDYVTIAMGVINDEGIEKLLVKYKDQASAKATIMETTNGRIWFSFSETPINYDPDVIRVYKDGTEVSGWF
ncbi:hypothetical protein [Psychrobacillus sp. L4]|uniref:hypothetical protein n=1 Tax=Psychrobacillus sp. L4 TaxID=3236892 RepID=UPI0036F3D057